MKIVTQAGWALTVLGACITAASAKPLSPLENQGREVFLDNSCAACHGSGPGQPGTAALAARDGDKRPAELEKRTDLTADMVQYFVRHGVANMPAFRKTEITDSQLNALGAYLARNNPGEAGK
jgi:mono/diheme cytochrome c family protein